VRQSSASKNVNVEAEKATVLEAVARQQPLKIQQNGKNLVCAAVNFRVLN
jgi:hypothetical protein